MSQELKVTIRVKYMADRLMEVIANAYDREEMLDAVNDEIHRIYNKNIFAHYFDIRTNHLNEKDWRRSFGINQLLYGMILECTKDHKLHENFDSVLEELKKLYKEDTTNE